MKTATLWKFHRRLAYLAGLAVVVWAASGLLHPLMNLTADRPASFAPPQVAGDAAGLLAPASLGDTKNLQSLRLVTLDSNPVYQLSFGTTEPRRYFNAITGAEIADADRDRAIALAKHYTGRSDVASAEMITAFNLDYPAINVFLPAWAVRFDGDNGFTVVVETGREQLVRLTNDNRQIASKAFQLIHTLPFLPEVVRVPLLTVLVGSVLIMAVAGMVLLLRWQGRRQGLYRWHRLLAWVVMLPMLAYPASGLLHLWTYAGAETAPVVESPIALSSLTAPAPAMGARTVRIGDDFYWRTPQAQWFAPDGEPLHLDDEAAALHLAGHPAIASATLVTSFTPEYGFANRILPVWRVASDHAVLFVDVAGGRIVRQVTGLDQAELWSFNHLHKWQFLHHAFGHGKIGMMLRDVLQVAITSLMIVLAGIGLWLRCRKP